MLDNSFHRCQLLFVNHQVWIRKLIVRLWQTTVDFAECIQIYLSVNVVMLVVGIQIVYVSLRKGVEVLENVKKIMR